jgi:hypothetical protein
VKGGGILEALFKGDDKRMVKRRQKIGLFPSGDSIARREFAQWDLLDHKQPRVGFPPDEDGLPEAALPKDAHLCVLVHPK